MVCAWRNFKNIFSRPLFTIIFRPKILFFVTYSILTGQTKVEFVINWVLTAIYFSMYFEGTFIYVHSNFSDGIGHKSKFCESKIGHEFQPFGFLKNLQHETAQLHQRCSTEGYLVATIWTLIYSTYSCAQVLYDRNQIFGLGKKPIQKVNYHF